MLDATRPLLPRLGDEKPFDATRLQNEAEVRSTSVQSFQLEVPGYILLDEVGRGGMGCVWRARDISFHREVAIKVLRDTADTERAAKRFKYEAQLTGQL